MSGPRPGRARRGRPAGRAARAAGSLASAGPTRARVVALRVLERVERTGAYADLALHAALADERLGPTERALATELVYGTLRARGRLDWLLAQVIPRPLEKLESPVRSVLRLGAYQIACMDGVPGPAAVDQAVRAARAIGLERATGLVNAALRRLVREHRALAPPSLASDPLGHLVHALSLPPWLAQRWLDEFGPEEAAALAAASNAPPPLAIRANRLRASRDELLAELRERWPAARATELSPVGIVLGHGGNPAADPAFAAGRFAVQDEGSQLVVALLDPQPGERVLDACAAPGAKATAIADCVGPTGRVVGLDKHPRRLALVAREARRLGLDDERLELRTCDVANGLPDEAPAGSFDRVLVDAPCSGLGTLRRNADLRWRVEPGDPGKLAATQRALLAAASRALRPGAALVYSTCTLTAEENEAVVQDFLAKTPGFRLAAPEALPECVRPVVAGGFLRTLPHRHGTDGFFAARLERDA